MRRNLKYIYIFLLTVILISTGCGESLEQDIVEKSNPYKLDTLKLEGGRDWGMSNPYLQDPRGPGTAKVKLVFDSLLDADEEGIIPWLAKDWEIDGDNYIFTINENSYFHDGEALTAEDIEFTLDFYEKYPPVNNILGSKDGYIIQSYKIINDHKIEIKVNQSYADTITKLGSFLILPKHIWEDIKTLITIQTLMP